MRTASSPSAAGVRLASAGLVLCYGLLGTPRWLPASEPAVSTPASAVAEAKAAPGKSFGWRGDGSGRYPGAKPPLEWKFDEKGGSRNIQWRTRLPGRSVSSPIVVGDGVYTTCEYDDLVCLDRRTGKIRWLRSHHYYDLMPQDERDSTAGLREAAEALAKSLNEANESIDVWPTPILEHGTLYTFFKTMHACGFKGPVASLRLPDDANAETTKESWARGAQDAFEDGGDGTSKKSTEQLASLLFHDGLIYAVDEKTVLRVWDAQTRALVYTQPLTPPSAIGYVSPPGQGNSPSLADGKIYLNNNLGTFWVIEPGRQFKLLAQSTLARGGREYFVCNPAFQGGTMYVRSTDHLFAIGEKP